VTYLLNYQHDIFVSYAHGPLHVGNEDPLSKWSLRLKKDLYEEIMTSLGTKDPNRKLNIWMDESLAGNQPVTDTIKPAVERSALLVVIMSPYFFQGPWCTNEVRWFSEANSDRGGSKERIFVVRAIETDATAWPGTLRDSSGHQLTGYRFHPPAAELDEESRPHGWVERDSDYRRAVLRLASDITKQIKTLDTAPPPSPVERTVFLGFMHDTIETRVELRERLIGAGLGVLPPESDDPVDETSLRKVLDKYLGRCQALVLMANEYGGLWPKDQPGGFIGLQIEKARQLDIPYHLWLQAGDLSKVRRPDYRQYLEALCQNTEPSLRHEDLDSFVEHVVQGLSGETKPSGSGELESTAVICSNRPDDGISDAAFTDITKEITDLVKTILLETGRDNWEFNFSDARNDQIKMSSLDKRIRESDAVLVLCFDQKWDWGRPLLRQLSLLSHLRTGGKARLLVAGPRDTGGGLYDPRTLGFETIDVVNTDRERLKDRLRSAILSAVPAKNSGMSESRAG
jgi:hypothetical protein